MPLLPAGLPFLVYGLVVLSPWPTLFGPVLIDFARFWFLDRMVWLHRDTTAGDERGPFPG